MTLNPTIKWGNLNHKKGYTSTRHAVVCIELFCHFLAKMRTRAGRIPIRTYAIDPRLVEPIAGAIRQVVIKYHRCQEDGPRFTLRSTAAEKGKAPFVASEEAFRSPNKSSPEHGFNLDGSF